MLAKLSGHAEHAHIVSSLSRFLANCPPIWILLILLMSGCTRSGDIEMAVISGTVSHQGKPIEDGEIRFVPIGETKGPTSGGIISNGRYEIKARGGVPVGTHRVEIRAFRVPDNPVPTDDPWGTSTQRSAKEQYLSKGYNEQSKLTVAIESGQTKINKDFNLP